MIDFQYTEFSVALISTTNSPDNGLSASNVNSVSVVLHPEIVAEVFPLYFKGVPPTVTVAIPLPLLLLFEHTNVIVSMFPV